MAQKTKETWRLLFVNAFVWMANGLYMPFISAFYTREGIPASRVGILMAMGPLAALFIQPIWARISDKSGRRRFVLCGVAVGAGCAMLLFKLGSGFAYYFIMAFLAMSFTTAMVPLSDAIITRRTRKLDLNYAIIRMGGTVGYALVVLVAGNFMKEDPSRMFLFCGIGFFVLALVCRLLPRDAENRVQPAEESASQTPISSGEQTSKRIFATPLVIFVMIFAFIIQFGGSTFFESYTSVYVIKLGYDHSLIGLFSCVSALSEVPVLLLINRLLKKIGVMKLMIFAAAMSVLRLLLVPTENMALIFVAQAMNGVTYMLNAYCCVTFVSEHVLPGRMSQGQSIIAMVQTGAGAMFGNLVGGALADYVGLRMAFIIFAGAAATLAVLNSVALVVARRKLPLVE